MIYQGEAARVLCAAHAANEMSRLKVPPEKDL